MGLWMTCLLRHSSDSAQLSYRRWPPVWQACPYCRTMGMLLFACSLAQWTSDDAVMNLGVGEKQARL